MRNKGHREPPAADPTRKVVRKANMHSFDDNNHWHSGPDSPRLEDPWDVHSPGDRPRSEAARFDTRGYVLGLILGTVALLLAASAVHGQSAPLPPAVLDQGVEESRSPKPSDREARQLAADYVDLLSQLRILADDYSSYYLDVSAGHNDDYRKALEQFQRAIQDSSFYFNYEAFADQLNHWQARFEEFEADLEDHKSEQRQAIGESLEELQDELAWHQDELDELRDELEEVEEVRRQGNYDEEEVAIEVADIRREMSKHQAALARIQTSIDTYHQGIDRRQDYPSLYRLTRSLRRELEVVTDLLDRDVLPRIESDVDIEEAVKNQVRVMIRESTDGRPGVVVRLDGADDWSRDIEVIIDTANLPGAPTIAWRGKGDAPGVDRPPRPPRPAVPSVDIAGRTMVFSEREGQFTIVKEAFDSVEAVTGQPVYIVNPTGELEVSGWQRSWVRARCNLKVSADSREEAQRLIEQIEMRLHRRSDAVFVEADAPDLSDPELRVDLSRVEIDMPASNPLIVRSSFGSINLHDLGASIKVSGSSTDISLDRVSGDVELGGTRGDMILSHVDGQISARNAYGALRLNHCEGDIRLQNLNAEISLSQCSGTAEIENNGPVAISHFEGPVTIRNVNGLVQVDNVSGDVTAHTSLKPMYISDVHGTVTLENANGAVHTENIAGRLLATNSRAPIYAVSPSGPVVLSNRSGNIELLLEHGLSGPSRVDVFDGLVNLRLSGDLNLLLNVESTGGQINSSLPVPVQQSGERRSARLALGDATQALNVTGTNSDVLIYETR